MIHYRTVSGREWRLRIMLLCFSSVLCIVLAEMGARAFWRLRDIPVPARHPERILYAFYPELRLVDKELPTHGDEFYDILLLGGSALTKEWGFVEKKLTEQLADQGHRNVRIFNLAVPAHTSRDSLLKYEALDKSRFEMLVFYHGINEARANNAPPQVFRRDYGHYGWYEIVNALAPHHGTASFALPYTLRYLVISCKQRWATDRYIPATGTRKDWVHYGVNPRSAVSFKENLGAFLDIARQRGDHALLMTFATFVPPDYSLEAFRKKRLAYGLHRSAIEIWGTPENVLRAVEAHNEIVRTLANEHSGVLFVDEARLLAGNARYFDDVCHLTDAGSSKFAEHLLDALQPSLRQNDWPSRATER